MNKTFFLIVLLSIYACCRAAVISFEQMLPAGQAEGAFYNRLVKKNGKPTIVKWYLPGCRPCNAIKPVFEALSEHYKNIQCIEISVSRFRNLATSLQLSRFPTLIFYGNKKELYKHTGFAPAEVFHQLIARHFGPVGA